MSSPTSLSPDREREWINRLALLRAAATGILDGLECPRCHQLSVSVWFTNPASDEYRSWFLCRECPFEMRATHSGEPAFYSRERQHPELQQYDEKVFQMRRLDKETN